MQVVTGGVRGCELTAVGVLTTQRVRHDGSEDEVPRTSQFGDSSSSAVRNALCINGLVNNSVGDCYQPCGSQGAQTARYPHDRKGVIAFARGPFMAKPPATHIAGCPSCLCGSKKGHFRRKLRGSCSKYPILRLWVGGTRDEYIPFGQVCDIGTLFGFV